MRVTLYPFLWVQSGNHWPAGAGRGLGLGLGAGGVGSAFD